MLIVRLKSRTTVPSGDGSSNLSWRQASVSSPLVGSWNSMLSPVLILVATRRCCRPSTVNTTSPIAGNCWRSSGLWVATSTLRPAGRGLGPHPDGQSTAAAQELDLGIPELGPRRAAGLGHRSARAAVDEFAVDGQPVRRRRVEERVLTVG